MRSKDVLSAFTTLSFALTACSTPTPTPTEAPANNAEPPKFPQRMNFTIYTCAETPPHHWCGPGDTPLRDVPVKITYPIFKNGVLVPTVLRGQTDDNGKTEVSGPFPETGGFSPDAWPQVTVGKTTYCLADAFIGPVQPSMNSQIALEDVFIVFDAAACSAPPQSG